MERSSPTPTINRLESESYSVVNAKQGVEHQGENNMKSLCAALLALSIGTAAMASQGQTAAGADPQSASRAESVLQNGRVPAHQSRKQSGECVGPVSFCNIYFGS
nr:hypothetical protein [Burkholderia singularis]